MNTQSAVGASEPTVEVTLTLTQVNALYNTSGIAITNLHKKAESLCDSSDPKQRRIGDAAASERLTLLGASQRLSAVMVAAA